MTNPIPQDDIRPNIWVTIRDIPEVNDAEFPFDHPHGSTRHQRSHRIGRKPQPGVPMRVLSIDLPFVYLAILDGDGDEVGPLIMDLREQPLVRIENAVADSIIEFGLRKRKNAHSRSTEIACWAAEVETANDMARIRSLQEAGMDDLSVGNLSRRGRGREWKSGEDDA